MTDEEFQKVLLLVEQGHTPEDATLLVGLRPSLLQDLPKHRWNQIQAASAKLVGRALKTVADLAEAGNLNASKFLLQTMRPERFGQKLRVIQQQVPATELPPSVEAKEKLYQYALLLFRKEPEMLNRLQSDLGIPLLPEASIVKDE